VRRLAGTKGALDARISTAGHYVSFVRGQNLHVVNLASGADAALTADGGGTITWGSAEFVSQEEMGRTAGHWWAPGDIAVAVERYDEAKCRSSRARRSAPTARRCSSSATPPPASPMSRSNCG
jgi:dipeptidyl-peptidase-4